MNEKMVYDSISNSLLQAILAALLGLLAIAIPIESDWFVPVCFTLALAGLIVNVFVSILRTIAMFLGDEAEECKCAHCKYIRRIK